MCNDNNRNPVACCLAKTLETILLLQQKGETCDILNDCSKPFLGPTPNGICLNTRPITIYSCCNNALWTMPYTLNGIDSTSTVFRIENLDDCCATFRVLAPVEDTYPYVATEDFFIIDLNCVGAIKCLGDTYIAGI